MFRLGDGVGHAIYNMASNPLTKAMVIVMHLVFKNSKKMFDTYETYRIVYLHVCVFTRMRLSKPL